MAGILERTTVPKPVSGKGKRPFWSTWKQSLVFLVIVGLIMVLVAEHHGYQNYRKHTSVKLQQDQGNLTGMQLCFDEVNALAVGAIPAGSFNADCTGGHTTQPIPASTELRPDQIHPSQAYILKRGDNIAQVHVIAMMNDGALIDFWSGPLGKLSLEQTMTFHQLGLDRQGDGNGLFPANT